MVSGVTRAIWIGVGVIATYEIITKTTLLASIVDFINKHADPEGIVVENGMVVNKNKNKQMGVFNIPQQSDSGMPTSAPIPSQALVPTTPPQIQQSNNQPSPTRTQIPNMNRSSQQNNTNTGRPMKGSANVNTPRRNNNPPMGMGNMQQIANAPQPSQGSNQNVQRGGNMGMGQPVSTGQPRQGGGSFPVNIPFSSKGADQFGCIMESDIGNSCRTEGQALPPGMQFYDGNFTFPTRTDGRMPGGEARKIEITAGGPGSSDGLCCGITTTLGKDKNGRIYFGISTEDWRDPNNKQRGRTLCEKGSCMGATIGLPNDINAQTNFSWHAERNANGSYTYCGKLNDMSSGCNGKANVLGSFTSNDIKPGVFQSNQNAKQNAKDPTRCRSDGFNSSKCMGMFTFS